MEVLLSSPNTHGTVELSSIIAADARTCWIFMLALWFVVSVVDDDEVRFVMSTLNAFHISIFNTKTCNG